MDEREVIYQFTDHAPPRCGVGITIEGGVIYLEVEGVEGLIARTRLSGEEAVRLARSLLNATLLNEWGASY